MQQKYRNVNGGYSLETKARPRGEGKATWGSCCAVPQWGPDAKSWSGDQV